MDYNEILYELEKQKIPKKEGDLLGSAFDIGIDTAITIVKMQRDLEELRGK